MIKKKKNNNPEVGQVYAIRLYDGTFGIAQVCYISEHENYLSVTVSFFSYQFKSIEEIKLRIGSINFTSPVLVITLADNPFKDNWILLTRLDVNYNNINVEEHITGTWGWFDKSERDSKWLLEMYFGIYPWDAFYDPNYLDKLLIKGVMRPNLAKLKSEFSNDELKEFGLL